MTTIITLNEKKTNEQQHKQHVTHNETEQNKHTIPQRTYNKRTTGIKRKQHKTIIHHKQHNTSYGNTGQLK